ncbi:hypothetical protein HPB51_004649 [Rhipicephalus microplus]|uniref:Uncharacterized protein n=1 Tax=Rhipicephalus microplus TaxID=6941 RepID=A0A9J6EG23_RHIMP|nr:hypothetical protein HPB51_004649 [Rhipicephalus microplus]
MFYRLEPPRCLRLFPAMFSDEYFAATTFVPVITWTPRNPMAAMDPGFQKLHDCFGCLRPTFHSSEGDPVQLLRLETTACAANNFKLRTTSRRRRFAAAHRAGAMA